MRKYLMLVVAMVMTSSIYAQSITNASFEDGTNGWTVNKMQLQTNDGMSTYKAGNTYIERWIAAPGLLGTASVKQTVTGLSNGVYRLTAAAMNISQNNESAAQVGAWIVGNGLRTAVTTRNTYTLDFFVTDGTAEIGFVADGASGNWVGCDNFTLTYRGNTNTYIQSAGNTVKNYANNLISTYGSDTEYSGLVSTLTTAINGGNLTTVANAAKAVVAGERAYRLRHPSGSAPTVTWNKRHARGSIWIFGRVSWSGSNVVEEGFCYSSTNSTPTLSDNYATDWLDSYGKVIWIQDLTPGTMYYIRPYAMTKTGAVGYGEVLKVPTLPQGDIHWSIRDSGDESADNHIRSSCEWAFDQWWDNLTQLTTYYPSIGHVSGVPTAECSYGGWCSCGDSWDYQKTGTILHEMLHGVGVGQLWMWGDFVRDQYPVWDALRFWNNDENATLSGDSQHLWPYGINGAHEDNGSDQLYIGNALVCEALGEAGLPLTDSQWLLPYYAFVQDDNTKYYIKSEDKNRGLTTHYLVSDNSGNLKWQEMTLAQAQADDKAAWYITFDASNQKYHIKNASTNKYICYSSADADNGFTTSNTATDIQMKKCRVDVNVGSQTYQGYYFLDYGSRQTMEAKENGVVGSTGFSIWDNATTQRWVILAAGSDVAAFEAGAVDLQKAILQRYLNGYTAAKNVSHTDKTSGATTALTNTINTINSDISGTVTMDQVKQYISDIKSAGLTFLNNTKPADGYYYDLTFLIENPDFTDSADGWSIDPTRNYESVEFYEKTFDLYQILPDMPAGTYRFTADAFQRPGEPSAVYTAYEGGTDNVNAVLYVNTTSQKIKNVMSAQQNSSLSNGEFTTAGNTYVPNNMESGSAYLNANKYNNYIEGDFAAGDLRIGLRGTVSNTYYWTMADNFKLYYMGADGVVLTLKEQLAANGFTQITALPADYSPYFFVLYDHNQDLSLIAQTSVKNGANYSVWYSLNDPRTNKNALWTLDTYMESNVEYQILANADYPNYQFQTEWSGNNLGHVYRASDNLDYWSRTNYEYLPDGYWTIQNGVYPEYGYLGPWNGTIEANAETALNKSGNAQGHFDIFTILRGDYVKRFDAWNNATYDNPLDITYVLENPGGERRTTIGWKSTGAGWQGQGNSPAGKVGGYYLESYNAAGVGNSDFYQVVSGLPDGYYRFSARGLVRDGGDQGFSIYANSESTKVTASDLNTRFNVIVQVLDGSLRVGAKAENVSKDWIAIDDAKLEFLGTDYHLDDGTYYLCNVKSEDFLDRDGNDARATFLGTPVTWTNGENGATIKFNNSNTYLAGRWWSTSNGGTGITWKVIPDNGGLKIQRTQPEDEGFDYLYMSSEEGANNQRVASNGKYGDNFNDWDNARWKFMTQAEYDAYVLQLSEEATAAPAAFGQEKVQLTRTLKGGRWNGFSVPFGFTVAGSPLEGASVKQFSNANGNEISFTDATSIVAGVPYIVKPTADVVNPQFRGVTMTNAEEAVYGEGAYKFAAHLYNTTLPTDGSVAYISTNDSSVKKLTSGGIKGMRSIFLIPTSGNVKALVLKFDDDTTAIMDLDGNITEGAIYNVAGQRMSAPQKGVNIINGKKVLVK